ncbi:MAG TPA: patatin-like phospholipase family protein [Thermodesulfobacteriota bacterium]|nr:patatin-like phospholipase family protein [Thermodesulfobacteriota bacterium]
MINGITLRHDRLSSFTCWMTLHLLPGSRDKRGLASSMVRYRCRPFRTAGPCHHGRRSRWPFGALLSVAALLLTACASPQIFHLPKVDANTACISLVASQDTVVGVSLSGGGSRAALFGAGGLEALGRLQTPDGRSVLEQVSYLSSVSGGGLTAAYYALHKPSREIPVLGPDGKMTEAYQAFFADLGTKVAQDFQNALIWRQISSFRFILNSALAATSLRELLEERLLGKSTFADLAVREKNGDSPRLMINATLFNDGRRLLLTTLPPDATQYDFTADLDRSLAERGITRTYPEVVKKRWESLLPVSPLELQFDPCVLRVTAAVAASAAFPPLVGPITFTVGNELDYWHAGDGGLYENLGLESLMFAFLKQMQDRKARRGLILAFNSSYPFSVGFKELRQRSLPWSIFNYDFSRIPSIMEERATAYWSLFYRSLQVEGVFPDDKTLRIVFLNHESAKWEEDLSDLPAACRNENPPLASPEEVQARIAALPTKFVIPSECDRQLLHMAAAKVVDQNRQVIEEFLAVGPTPREANR